MEACIRNLKLNNNMTGSKKFWLYLVLLIENNSLKQFFFKKKKIKNCYSELAKGVPGLSPQPAEPDSK